MLFIFVQVSESVRENKIYGLQDLFRKTIS